MSERAPREYELDGAIPALAAAAEATVPLGEVREAGVLVGASYTPVANIVGADTNSRSIVIINKGQDGNGNVEMARINFVAGTNADDFDETELTLGVAGNRAVVAGDIIVAFSDAVGTGLADPGGQVRVSLGRS